MSLKIWCSHFTLDMTPERILEESIVFKVSGAVPDEEHAIFSFRFLAEFLRTDLANFEEKIAAIAKEDSPTGLKAEISTCWDNTKSDLVAFELNFEKKAEETTSVYVKCRNYLSINDVDERDDKCDLILRDDFYARSHLRLLSEEILKLLNE